LISSTTSQYDKKYRSFLQCRTMAEFGGGFFALNAISAYQRSINLLRPAAFSAGAVMT
jgi:hypothetical protein